MKRLFGILAVSICSYASAVQSDSLALITYLDGIIESKISDRGLAGATMALVKDGKVISMRGYGYADVDQNIRVNPNRTLFRIGSISKTFIWTAFMQLQSQGKLVLDEPISTYLPELDFKVREGEEPIKVIDLMNHNAGFEDRIIGLFSQDPESVRSMQELLMQEPPERVRPPASYASYSNYGAGLGARIVEIASGMEWNDYVEQNILSPVGMSSSTFRQPLPNNMNERVSKGYSLESGQLVEHPFEYVPMTAIGGASSTAADMAKYMIMHLQLGMIDSVSVLDSAAAVQMQSPSFRHHPSVNPIRHGFMDFSRNGQLIFGHGGDTFWFHSLMALFPEENMGLFISFNTAENVVDPSKIVYSSVLRDFTDYLYPITKPEIKRAEDADLAKYTGEYEMNRYPHSSLAKMMKMAMVISVYPEDGLLAMNFGGNVSYWSPQGNNAFVNTDSRDIIAFDEKDGAVDHLFIGDFPIFAFDRISGLDTPGVHMLIFVVTTVLFLVTLVHWPMAFLARRGYREDRPKKLPLAAKYLAWFNVLFYFLFFMLIGVGFANPTDLVYGIPTLVKYALAIPFLNIVLLLLMGFMAAWIWRETYSNRWSRLFYYSLVLTFVVAIWQLNYWNLLGWNY